MIINSFIIIYANQIIASLVSVVAFIIIRIVVDSIIGKVGKKSDFSESRTSLVKRYINYLIFVLTIVILISIWGIKSEQVFLFISSVLTVIGVAFFAQWSILSNVTAGIIVFFSFPFKIGNTIEIMDKEYPIKAKIIDIKAFYTLLKTSEGEDIVLPNNLLLQKGIIVVSS